MRHFFRSGWLLGVCCFVTGCGETSSRPIEHASAPPSVTPKPPTTDSTGNGSTSAKMVPKNQSKSASIESDLPAPPSGLKSSPLSTGSLPKASAPPANNPPELPQLSTNSAVADRQPSDDSDPYLPRRKLGPLTLVDVRVNDLPDFGLRHSDSKHLQLITDLPEAEVPVEFHAAFEQAIDQWVAFCDADPRRFQSWRLTCFLVVDEAKFQRAGLFPMIAQLPNGSLPPGGWQYGNQIWVRKQQGDYYTRHMLLHEATHAFFSFNFGALGSPWLAEGLAEYFAVHRWTEGKLELAARVTNKDELPYWGRVKLIRDAYRTGQPKSLLEVMKFPPSAFPQTDSYAWSWAAVSLYAGHPQLRQPFVEQVKRLGQMSDTQWNRQLLEALPMDRQQLETQWQVDTTTLQYGHDFARTAIQWRAPPLANETEYQFALPADGAWHSTGLRLTPGEWEVLATGSYQVAQSENGPWIAQPAGITIRYVLGAPLGQVQYALRGDPAVLQGMSELTQPQPIGARAILQTSGEELFLRTNDTPNQLDDNQGQVAIVIRRL